MVLGRMIGLGVGKDRAGVENGKEKKLIPWTE